MNKGLETNISGIYIISEEVDIADKIKLDGKYVIQEYQKKHWHSEIEYALRADNCKVKKVYDKIIQTNKVKDCTTNLFPRVEEVIFNKGLPEIPSQEIQIPYDLPQGDYTGGVFPYTIKLGVEKTYNFTNCTFLGNVLDYGIRNRIDLQSALVLGVVHILRPKDCISLQLCNADIKQGVFLGGKNQGIPREFYFNESCSIMLEKKEPNGNHLVAPIGHFKENN